MPPHLCLLGDANSPHTRRWALEMQSSASCSASSIFEFSHKLKASLTMPETNAALCRDDRRSLV